MKLGEPEKARNLLPRSLQSLEKRKRMFLRNSLMRVVLNFCTDLKTISRFAQMEYKLGEPERGRTIFEGIVNSHPKRLDFWLVYIDMEAVQRSLDHLRYERPAGLQHIWRQATNMLWPETSSIGCSR
jgi:rRNA biogenesis protein RRP5